MSTNINTVNSLVDKYSKQYNVESSFIKAIIKQESDYDQDSISSAGAIGIMQLMSDTAKGLNVNPYDLEQNIKGGTSLIASLLKKYDGNKELALAGYNAGEGAVSKYGGVPPYKETQGYIKNIMSNYNKTKTTWITGDTDINQTLLERLSNLASDKNVKLNISSGGRSYSEQLSLYEQSDKTGKMVAKPGTSIHETGFAADIFDNPFFRGLTNIELEKYELFKPMDYEDWHVQPIESKGLKKTDIDSGIMKLKTNLNDMDPLGEALTGEGKQSIDSFNPISDLFKADWENKMKPVIGMGLYYTTIIVVVVLIIALYILAKK